MLAGRSILLQSPSETRHTMSTSGSRKRKPRASTDLDPGGCTDEEAAEAARKRSKRAPRRGQPPPPRAARAAAAGSGAQQRPIRPGLAEQLLPQVLILLKGHPGSGKSTLAARLARQLRFPLIDKDDARDCLSDTNLQPSAPSANALSYDVMLRFAARQLSVGLSCVLDCPFARVDMYESARRLAEQHGAAVALVDCVPGDERVWRQRLEARADADAAAGTTAQPHKPASWAALQGLLVGYAGCWRWSLDGSTSVRHHLIVDTTAGEDDGGAAAVAKVIGWLRGAGLVQ